MANSSELGLECSYEEMIRIQLVENQIHTAKLIFASKRESDSQWKHQWCGINFAETWIEILQDITLSVGGQVAPAIPLW